MNQILTDEEIEAIDLEVFSKHPRSWESQYAIDFSRAIEQTILNKLSEHIKQLTAERDCWIDTANMFKDAAILAADQIRKCDYTPARSTLLTAIANNG